MRWLDNQTCSVLPLAQDGAADKSLFQLLAGWDASPLMFPMKYLWNRSPQGIWCLPLLLGLGVPMPITKAQALEAPPDTPKIPIVNEYHGQKVTDDYEWLENAEEPKVPPWTEAQTKRTRSYLESLPEYNQFLQEFQKDVVGKTVRYTEIKFAGGKVFASKFEPPKPQPVIICRTSLAKEGEERTVFDPAAEYGSVKNREQFLAKYGYSPYHHLVDGVKYPAVLIIAGENDHRVASWHGKKMAARLQAATSSGRPILLSVSTTAGHGFGTAFAERLRDEAALYTFFYDQLAMDAGPIGKR